jgi:NarL family two-component system response regulator LiaR
MAEEKPIRVVLVDDHFQIHKIVETLLNATHDLRLVGQCANGREALELCARLRPDVVLMDVVMPVMDGIEATRLLHEQMPDVKALVLSNFQDHESIHAMLQNGAVGYITKTSLSEDLVDTLRAAHQGKMVFSSDVVAQLLTQTGEAEKTNYHLTGREMEVLTLMAKGLNMPEIAAKLTISQPTVKFHIGNICNKMGVHSRSEALVVAAKNGLI